uniref:BHLH domain-containing protein n=1 Tax=Romanomermis culicivorax TaxID=13658 RepID=A0A915JAJ4_ROMCU
MTTKEQTRTAAKKRRERENTEYSRLCRLLPLPIIITDQLDKASVIRLVITYLNLKKNLQNLGAVISR